MEISGWLKNGGRVVMEAGQAVDFGHFPRPKRGVAVPNGGKVKLCYSLRNT
jgi:hypothetical protein